MSQDDRKLPNDVEQLKAMIAAHGVALAARDAAIVEQTAAIIERDETIAQHATVIAAQHETISQQLQKLDGLQQQLARVLRKQYGPQKERIAADQLTLFSLEEIELLAADLQPPLYELVCDRVRASRVIPTDGTGIKMLAKGGCVSAKFWAYIGDDANPYTAYEFSLTREGKEPTRFLEGFRGDLQADPFSGYDQISKSGQVIEVACMAHCRRYWWESKETDSRRAHAAISYITRLYELEEQFREAKLTGDALRDARQRDAVPILNAFGSWLESECDRVLPQSPIGKAFTYSRNQWPALRRYTDDGALSIDNNLAERMMKLPAIGRKNWLFVGSLRAAAARRSC